MREAIDDAYDTFKSTRTWTKDVRRLSLRRPSTLSQRPHASKIPAPQSLSERATTHSPRRVFRKPFQQNLRSISRRVATYLSFHTCRMFRNPDAGFISKKHVVVFRRTDVALVAPHQSTPISSRTTSFDPKPPSTASHPTHSSIPRSTERSRIFKPTSDRHLIYMFISVRAGHELNEK